MSISDAINNARTKINNAYNALQNKGAVMPVTKDLEHLPISVESIPTFDFFNSFKNWGYSGSKGYLAITSYEGESTDVVVDTSLPSTCYLQGGSNSCFANNVKITSVDLKNKSLIANNKATMNFAFYGCTNLVSVSNISSTANSWEYTFKGCSNFNQDIQVSSNVDRLYETFNGCIRLNPSNVVNLRNANLDLLPATFYGCSSFNQDVQIPDTVTSMSSTFFGCTGLNQNIQIPMSVVHLAETFAYCPNLDKNIQIPLCTETMNYTFEGCRNMTNVIVQSPFIQSATGCFNNTTKAKNVYTPFKYINGVNTTTYNTFKTAISGKNGVTLVNISVGPGSTISQNWDGLSTRIGTTTTTTCMEYKGGAELTAPLAAPGIDVYFMNSFAQGQTQIVNADLGNVPFASGNARNIFNGCTNLVNVNRMNPNVKDLSDAFYNCTNFNSNLGELPNVTSMSYTFFNCRSLNQNVYVGDKVNSMAGTYINCVSLNPTNVYIGNSVKDMTYAFAYCSNMEGNINIYSTEVSVADGCFYETPTSKIKDVYIPYRYSNGVFTKTYNAFNTAGYFGGINGVVMHDIGTV